MSADLWLLLFLRCTAAPCRSIYEKTIIYDQSKGRSLRNHVISSHNVTSALDCAFKCLETTGCKSYNYQETGSPLHLCELNNQSRTCVPPDYVIKPGFTYHEADQSGLSDRMCVPSPCQNGGTCEFNRCTDSYNCLCKPGHIGQNCETGIGLKGSSSSQPDHSCLNIKRTGQDTGDGIYWIQPGNNTETPFTVYCDMTTDGGGWTQITNLTINNPAINHPYREVSNYREISNLGENILLDQPGLQQLKQDMGFTQLRYYCRKVSVDRVFHIMTANNDSGYDVVRYFVLNPVPQATACNSFIRLPDDQSILTTMCAMWGKPANTSTWGVRTGSGSSRPYRKVVYQQDAHVSFFKGEFKCDDNDQNRQVGDNWKMFVR